LSSVPVNPALLPATLAPLCIMHNELARQPRIALHGPEYQTMPSGGNSARHRPCACPWSCACPWPCAQPTAGPGHRTPFPHRQAPARLPGVPRWRRDGAPDPFSEQLFVPRWPRPS